MRNFRNWHVWKNGKILVKEIYLLTANYPDSEKYSLSNQLRRASVSIPANIAEGAGRSTDKDFRSFLYIALGSAFELETLVDLSFDLGFISKEQYDLAYDKVNHIQRQLNSLINKIKV
jgi:four helix bundle protein